MGWFAPQLAAESGGALPFDLRVAAYDLTDVRAFLDGLTPARRALYRWPIRVNVAGGNGGGGGGGRLLGENKGRSSVATNRVKSAGSCCGKGGIMLA